MTVTMNALVVCLALTVAAAAPASAQPGRGRAGAPDGGDLPGVTPGEIQRMFDSYALMQAQDQLKIADDKFPQFLARFKALQDTRRRQRQERNRAIQDLRRLTNDPQSDDGQIRERIKAVDELDARARSDVARAYESVNQLLDVRQQAKFRVFEENMERRELELVMRARQANRPKL